MTTDSPDPNKANADAAHREAWQYWGYLIKSDKCGTEKFDRLLKGIAAVISTKFEPNDSPDLTPTQLAAFYRAVGGNYDVLFIDTPASSISFIYRSLGAFHSLQPAPGDDGYSQPTIPALKAKGFVTWQTIQLLLGPEEHVPFLQKAVELFDVKDPDTGEVFPKILPKECFPDKPDDAMEQWYERVAERLKREAEVEATEKPETTRVRVEVPDDGPRTSSEASDNERYGAASYFADPLYRKSRPRPSYMRHFSRQPAHDDRGVVGRVRHMLNPFYSRERRRHSPSRYSDEDDSDVDATPIATVPSHHVHHRYPATGHKRPSPPRRNESLSDTDSDSEAARPPPRRESPALRDRRSHESPTERTEYFPPFYDGRDRRHSRTTPPEYRRPESNGPPPPLYGPTKAPLFATHVAQLQAQNYVYDRRPSAAPASSPYRPQNVRYTVKPVERESPYARERARDRDRERERRMDDYDSHSSRSSRHHHHTRRRSEEYPLTRDRERGGSARTRSHDRVKDEWDPRERSRDRDMDRDRDGDDRVRARYVPSTGGVQDGVGGRRYPPIEQLWR